MKDLEKYRILKQAGLLTESETMGYDGDERQDLMGLISDIEKDAYGVRLRRDLSAWSLEDLQGEVDRLQKHIEDEIADEREADEWEHARSVERDVDLETLDDLAYRSAEEEHLERRPPGGTYGRKHFSEAHRRRPARRGKRLLREYTEGDVPSRQEIEDAVLEVWWSERSVDLVDVFDFLKMVGWPELAIQNGLERIG